MNTLQRMRVKEAGFSLVELMVSMVIALVLTLVISKVMLDHEVSKRSTTTLNDANQNGALAAYELDRAIRSAGSGFMQSWSSAGGNSLGCLINSSRDGAIILPRPSAFPEPFTGVNPNVRLAPVVVQQGTDSDVLIAMSGNAGFAEVGRAVLAVSTAPANVRLVNTLGWQQDDLVLLVEDGLDCMLQQVGAVAAGATDLLPLSGSFFSATGTSANLGSFGTATPYAIALGNISTQKTRNNPPEFKLYGVDPTRYALVTYDLLTQGANEAPLPLADGVVAMRAVYGIDIDGDGDQDAWQAPTGAFASAALLNGSAASQSLLRQIVSVRVGLIMRTSLLEKEAVNPAGTEVELFKDIDMSVKRELTGDELYARHRTVEITIPLRNVLLL
ncbi:PilW family protein [Rhizobacter sp. Root1221]|uniref:PilW family protein n=1 Tax=Rhizobacter sp. Root1221 TaxID=1736433 RepID=UPI0006FEC01B|nr:PilW family protein [Rhizobacter sp. Root1221]KQW02591.1 hypothetical protein ASC87_12820 [Rhizobacter sp. Root1221]